MQPTISQAPFGTLPDGRAATLFTLTNRNGVIVRITDFGGIITQIHAPDRDGAFADVTLGFDEVGPYWDQSPYFGALIGRYGNRIAGGRFELDGESYQLSVNDGGNHLHGGAVGFSRVLWNASILEGDSQMGLTLTYLSTDGEEGYPGNLTATVVYQLTDANELLVKFHAITDRATPVNLTQHAYFNLAGQGDILGHQLEIHADSYTPVDANLIPTGLVAPVAGTPFDFRSGHPIGDRIGDAHEQLRFSGGYDHNFALHKPIGKTSTLAARVRDPGSGRVLELWTQEPGVQFYSGNFLDGKLTGKGWNYTYRSGFCLEPQHFPDSPNQPAFPCTILRPGDEYATESKFVFLVEK